MLNLEENSSANHVREMSKYFNAVLDEGADASTITMDNEKAKGFISSYRIFHGLTVWIYNIEFHSDFSVELDLSDARPYYFCYNVKGHFLHRFGRNEEFATIHQNQNMIVSGCPTTSAQVVFPSKTKLEIAVILVDIQALGNVQVRNAQRMHTKIQRLFGDGPSEGPHRHLGEIDSEMAKFASIICENDTIDLIGGLLTEGAVLNMLASQIKAYGQAGKATTIPSPLSRAELSKITSLGEYVIANLETKLSIADLSSVFQLSPKKLQLGVKHLYGDTVGHYIMNLRLGHAKELFLTTDLNVSEVCRRIGISSPSYFSKIFKERYGVLPSAYRKQS